MVNTRGWLVLLAFAGAACGGAPGGRPDLILIVLDTVRADRLSCYGYDRETTPRIDALGQRGVRFERASATSGWTVPSHASLFTGLYPRDHRATQERARLGLGIPTLAEILSSTGYVSYGVSGNPLVGPVTGLDRGFDDFVSAWRSGAPGADPDHHPVIEGVRRALDRRPEGRPMFLFVNFMEAHHPYVPSAEHRARFLRDGSDAQRVKAAQALTAETFYVAPERVPAETLAASSDLYDAELLGLDELVGATVDLLEAKGTLENAVLVITADHGESFGEHGHLRHLFQLYDSVVRIPLIFVLPGGEAAGTLRRAPVSLVDVFTTLLARAGTAPAGPDHAGRNLFAASATTDSVAVFSEYYYPRQALANFSDGVVEAHPERFAPYRRRLRAVEHEGVRLIVSSSGEEELYDLRKDPEEQKDLSGVPGRQTDLARLRARLREFVARGAGVAPLREDQALPDPTPAFGDLDPVTAARLQELGYLRR